MVQGAEFRFSEFIARGAVGISLVALVFAMWDPNLVAIAKSTALDLRGGNDGVFFVTLVRIIPRLSVFVMAGLLILLLQGSRPSTRLLLKLALVLVGLQALLLEFPPVSSDSHKPFHQLVFDLGRVETSLLAAVLLGTALGRSIEDPVRFLTLLFCAIAGDIWLSSSRVPDLNDSAPMLALLRLPWPAPTGNLGLAPTVPDIVMLAAMTEAARTLEYPVLSVVMGALAGYCGSSFLALEPWPGVLWSSMFMCASGVLISCWPDLKCNLLQLGRALCIGLAFLLALLALSAVRARLYKHPQVPSDPLRYRNIAAVVTPCPLADWPPASPPLSFPGRAPL